MLHRTKIEATKICLTCGKTVEARHIKRRDPFEKQWLSSAQHSKCRLIDPRTPADKVYKSCCELTKSFYCDINYFYDITYKVFR
jgi:hypothetical protein